MVTKPSKTCKIAAVQGAVRSLEMREEIMAKARQFNISVGNKPGTVAEAIRALAAAKINVTSVLGWNPSGSLQLILDIPRRRKRRWTVRASATRILRRRWSSCPTSPGAAQVPGKARKEGTNLRTICATANKKGTNATVVWTPES